MKVINTADLAPTKKKLTLQIEPDDLATEREEAYQELGKEAVIPGFRKGHVPRQFLEYRFDKTIRKEAFGEALEKAIRDAAKEQDLRFVGSPSVDEEGELESIAEKATGEPVEINVTLEYIPPFDLPEYKGLRFTLPEFHVTDAMVNAEIDNHREAAAYYVAVDDRPSKEGDFLIVGIETTRDGKPFEPLTRQRLMVSNLGRESDLKGFDEGLLGKTKGEKFELEFEAPEGHPLHEEGGGIPLRPRERSTRSANVSCRTWMMNWPKTGASRTWMSTAPGYARHWKAGVMLSCMFARSRQSAISFSKRLKS